MQTILDEADYTAIAQKLMPMMMKKITEKYDLVPKQHPTDDWVNLDTFVKSLPVIKAKEWVRTFILPLPEMSDWVINVNPGKGRRTKVNITKAKKWVDDHQNEIDWNQSLPS